ncbi:PulJ/GspJ family protein, partial [Pseudomonas viridiflava]
MNKHQRGFTLLEVMVAILLMSIVSLIAWRGLDSVTRTDARLRENTEQTESLLRAFNQLERDMALRASIEMQEPDLDGDQN